MYFRILESQCIDSAELWSPLNIALAECQAPVSDIYNRKPCMKFQFRIGDFKLRVKIGISEIVGRIDYIALRIARKETLDCLEP